MGKQPTEGIEVVQMGEEGRGEEEAEEDVVIVIVVGWGGGLMRRRSWRRGWDRGRSGRAGA